MKNRKKLSTITLGMLGAGLVALGSGSARAGGIPATSALTYAGTLEDPGGAPLVGEHTLEVRLWADPSGGGASLCATPSRELDLTDGRFSVELPDACTEAVARTAPVYTEVVVDGLPLPREKVSAVPFAVEARHALTAETATRATGAEQATSARTADTAIRADSAGEADHAVTADRASDSLRADTAKLAEQATTAKSADMAAMAKEASHVPLADDAQHAQKADYATAATSAKTADRATVADGAASDFAVPGKLDFGLKYHACGMSSAKGAQSCACPSGTWLLAGGVIAANQVVRQSFPDPAANSWRGVCAADASAAGADCFGVYAVCARVKAPAAVE